MSKRSQKEGRLTAVGLLLLTQCLTQAVQAKAPEQLLRGVFDTVNQSRSRDNSPQSASQTTPQGDPALEQ